MSAREVQFQVAGIPAPQGSHRAFTPPGARFPVVTDDNPNTKPWRAVVAYAAMQVRPQPLFAGAVTLTVRFYLPRPKSLPKRVQYPTKRPDIDKLQRALFDALKGIIWNDDAQVTMVMATKHYGDPGASVVVREVGS